jgi:hypothetical protein
MEGKEEEREVEVIQPLDHSPSTLLSYLITFDPILSHSYLDNIESYRIRKQDDQGTFPSSVIVGC